MAGRFGRLRWFGIALLAWLVPTLAQSQTEAPPGVTSLVSVPAEGQPSDGESWLPESNRTISSDGRHVVFVSTSKTMAGGGDRANPSAQDVFIRDRQRGTTELVSVNDAGDPAAVPAGQIAGGEPAVSGDGNVVVFGSHADNLHRTPECMGGTYDIFIARRDSGFVTPVTSSRLVTDPSGTESCQFNENREPSISQNGDIVAFASWGRINWAGGSEAPSGEHICVSAGVRGRDEQISVNSAGEPGTRPLGGDNDSERPRLDGKGERVAFVSRLHGLHPAADGRWLAYVRDRVRRTTELVSTTPGGQARSACCVAISDNGRHVAFVSRADDLAPGDTNERSDVFVRDLATGETELVSIAPDGRQFPGWAGHPDPGVVQIGRRHDGASVAISGDGRVVVFSADPGDGVPRLWLRDRATGVTEPVALRHDDVHRGGGSPAVSADGMTIAFSTDAQLVREDQDAARDVYTRERLCGVAGPFDPPSTRAAGPCAPSTLELTALEITQGIQNLRNDVPLIAGRRTWVRAHVQVTGTDRKPGVRARLVGYHEDTKRRLPPLVASRPGRPSSGTIDVLDHPSRRTLDDSFVFELPPDWTTGVVGITFEGVGDQFTCKDPDEDCFAVAFFSRPGPTIDVQLAGVVWNDAGGGRHEPDAVVMAQAVNQIRGVFPVADVRAVWGFNLEPGFFDSDGHPSLVGQLHDLYSRVEKARSKHGCPAPLSERCLLAGILTDTFHGVPPDKTIAAGLSNIPSDAVLAFVDRKPDDSLLLAHELGHALGRRHVLCVNEKNPDPAYPFPGGQLGGPLASDDGDDDRSYWGTDVYLATGPRGRVVHPVQGHDFMTYCSSKWSSTYTWDALYDAIDKRFDPTRPFTAAAQRAAPNTPDALVVAGVVVDGRTRLVDVDTAPLPLTAEDPNGSYALRVEDAGGATLLRHRFAEPEDVDHSADAASFLVAVPVQPGARRVVIEAGGTDVASRTGSAGAPSVRVTAPTGGEHWRGDNATVRWVAEDPDGDPLTFTLDYSSDGGATWRPLAARTDGTRATVDLRLVPGSDDAMVRVSANDGFHGATSTSPAFTVADRPPVVVIEETPDGLEYGRDQTVILHAIAFDAEAGHLTGSALQWSSDRDGRLGTGTTLAVPAAGLSLGRHDLTVTARDDAGNRATAGTAVDIVQVLAGTVRLAGANRVATAVRVSEASFADGAAGAVVLARADLFPDALAGAPLGVAVDAPVLLSGSMQLHPATAAELQRVLAPGGTVYLLGGPVALADGVAAAVEALGYATRRLGGADRYATAAIIADRGLGAPDTAFLADGRDFPDALIASAAAASRGAAVLLTAGPDMPAATADHLARTRPVTKVAIGASAAAADPSADEISGLTPAETSVEVARTLFAGHAVVGIATTRAFPDGLAGGAHIGRLGGPLLLSDADRLPSVVFRYLDAPTGRATAYLYGGPVALSEPVRAAVSTALGR